MMMLGKNAKMHLEENPEQILKRIQDIVMEQQRSFEKTFQEILGAMKEQKVSFLNDTQLNAQQRNLVQTYFNEKVRTNIFPLMIESIPELPNLHDKSIYMACMLGNTQNSFMNSYALIEVPTDRVPRFFVIPGHKGYRHVILLEDIIRCCLPELFTQFGFDLFEGYIIKVTRDAELDIDDDLQTNVIERIEKGLKNRKKGKAVRLVYDKTIQKNLLAYLCKLLNLTRRDHLIPGGRIHNFGPHTAR
jgi:polyphosphate kinase